MKTKISKEEENRYEQLQLIALDYARNGNTQELEKMIEAGMSVNLSTAKDDTLVMLASYNGNFETVQMLISHKANLNKINQRGQTPLEGVCFKGYLNIVKLLVANKAQVETKAIIYASIFGNKEIVKYLKAQSKKVSISVKVVEFLSFFTPYLKAKLVKT